MAMHLTPGMKAETTDGPCGEVADIVIDPVRRRVTHVVIERPHHHDRARLVPISAITSADGHVVLSWSDAALGAAPLVEEKDFIPQPHWPHPVHEWDAAKYRMLAWPFYTGYLGQGMSTSPGSDYDDESTYTTTTFDHLPKGSAEIRRTSDVVSSDDHVVGHVDGFILDGGHTITHVVLDHGHLWGHREVTIPAEAVEIVTSSGVQLKIPRDAVEALPSVPFDRHHLDA